MTASPRLGFTYLTSGQAAPETAVNEIGAYLESGSGHFIFKDRDLATPPGSPANGDCYLVATSPTGAWTGKAGYIAYYLSTAWVFISVIEGYTAWVNDENLFIGYDGAAWSTLSAPSGSYQPLDADLTAIAALSGTNNIYYRSAANTWSSVTISTGLSFSGGTLSATGTGSTTSAAVTFNTTGGAAAGTTFDGSVARTIDYSTVGAFKQRTVTGTSNEVTVTNGDGSAGNPTLSLPSALTFTGKTITGGSVTPAATPTTTAIGYLGCPVATHDATYTTVMSDAGTAIYHTSGSAHTWTIDSNANVAYPVGTILTFINENAGGVVTLAITSDTLRWGSSTGSRSLAANGTATAIKVASTTWRLTGDGIT